MLHSHRTHSLIDDTVGDLFILYVWLYVLVSFLERKGGRGGGDAPTKKYGKISSNKKGHFCMKRRTRLRARMTD
jgi:hypothetical protein